MKLVVFGANGGTGHLLCAQALEEGHAVTAVTRHPGEFPLRHPQLSVIGGDVFDAASVEEVIAGHDAVISAIGVPYSLKKVVVYSAGTANILAAMARLGVRRLIVVSSSGTDPAVRSRDTGGGLLFEKLLKPLLVATLGRTLYADMLRMERLVTASAVDWTIVRPGALFHTQGITDYRTAEDFVAGQYTSRADLADCVLRRLDEERSIRSVVAVATVDPRPTMLGVFWNEALQAVSR